MRPSVTEVADFLVFLFQQHNLSYSALNTARSALSCLLPNVDGVPVGKHDSIKRLLTGFFNIRPSIPRYSHTWDVTPVLDYLRNMHPLTDLSLKSLTLKLTMLLALVTGQRCQTLQKLNLKNLTQGQQLIFSFDSVLKHSRPGSKSQIVKLSPYELDKALCIVTVINDYIRRTECIRKQESQLLISFVKPHNAVSTDTIARWLKTIMTLSGVDTTIFKAHSCRSASTSKAKDFDIPIDTILQAGGWSSDKTFYNYYHKPQTDTFAHAVLHSKE